MSEMPTPIPDLAALREKAEAADGYHVLIHPRDVFAVLALVEDLRAENERLREALIEHGRAVSR